MPKGTRVIRSPNPDFPAPLEKPSVDPPYSHGATNRRGPIPMAFQITSPFDPLKALLPHALVLHVNPASLSETHTKKVERIQTRGGFVEQHWPDDLSEISADGSTGAFMNLYTGTSSVLRQRTIAWDKYRDLYDVFHNNGSVYDPYGAIVLQGNVMLMFDRGTYIGYFRSFETEETEDSPFAFRLNWSFKVQQTVVKLPGGFVPREADGAVPGLRRGAVPGVFPVPAFQFENRLKATGENVPQPTPTVAAAASPDFPKMSQAERDKLLADSAKKEQAAKDAAKAGQDGSVPLPPGAPQPSAAKKPVSTSGPGGPKAPGKPGQSGASPSIYIPPPDAFTEVWSRQNKK